MTMFKIIDTNSNTLNELLLLFQCVLWWRFIDQLARGVPPKRELDILTPRLRYWWFSGVEYGDYSASYFDMIIRRSYLIYGRKKWDKYMACYNICMIVYTQNPKQYTDWMMQSGHRTIGIILGKRMCIVDLINLGVIPKVGFVVEEV